MEATGASAADVGTTTKPSFRRAAENLRTAILIWAVLLGAHSLFSGGIYLGDVFFYEVGALPLYGAAFAYFTGIINMFFIYICLEDNTEYMKSVLPKTQNIYLMCIMTSIFLVGSLAVWKDSALPCWDAPRLIGCLLHLLFVHLLVGLLKGKYSYEQLQHPQRKPTLPPSVPSPAPADTQLASSTALQNPSDTNLTREKEEDYFKQIRIDGGPFVTDNCLAPVHNSHLSVRSATSGPFSTSEA